MMIEKYEGEYYFLSTRYFSRFEVDGERFKNVDEAYEFYKETQYGNDWETMRLHYLYKSTLAKFNQNLLLQEKLLEIDSGEFDTNDEYGNILHLVHTILKSTKNVEDMIKEQEEVFNWKILE